MYNGAWAWTYLAHSETITLQNLRTLRKYQPSSGCWQAKTSVFVFKSLWDLCYARSMNTIQTDTLLRFYVANWLYFILLIFSVAPLPMATWHIILWRPRVLRDTCVPETRVWMCGTRCWISVWRPTVTTAPLNILATSPLLHQSPGLYYQWSSQFALVCNRYQTAIILMWPL